MDKTLNLKGKRIAILFDVENISPEEILPYAITKLETSGFNVYPRKIIFNNISQLKKSFLGNAIKSYHLDIICAYSATGKNIADFRLYIEALDLLYKNPDIEGFCIVSGDADFAELVIKLHHENKYVIGIGPSSKSKIEYVNLFDQFIFIEDLIEKEVKKTSIKKENDSENKLKKKEETIKSKEKPKKTTKKSIGKKVIKKEVKKEIEEKIIRTESDKNDSFYSELSSQIKQIIVDFNAKGNKEIFYSNLVKELKDRSYYLESFTRITFDDIEKCGFHLIRKEEDKPETSYITT